MRTLDGQTQVAKIFKALGNEGRLIVLWALSQKDCTVSELAATTDLSQPLVSQHLRSLKQVNLVSGNRQGKEVVYSLADHHVAHIVEDAFIHVTEGEHND
ncbi:ArsR/SmtB family transcription factor [Arcanobacterium ihumii]|uniref:ArsR/SmtB family transcription factor n=1 Tax=Arcanobacterium ihumii TaxID=2138162 RepID=UPI000F54AB93|nr:metalloregulator ArsR/SmtB family transcription factor [Arcanobacterium ihumii]